MFEMYVCFVFLRARGREGAMMYLFGFFPRFLNTNKTEELMKDDVMDSVDSIVLFLHGIKETISR
jgi:hypothetical protein